MRIEKIESWACDTPISHPIDLGRFVVRQRSYLAVRVHTSSGLVADCVTQSRGSPLDVIVAEVLAPRLVGKDALDLSASRIDLERDLTALEMDGAIGRAWSALEICLQDLRAQAAGWPLWRLLGGAPRSVPVHLVEGYSIEGEEEEAFVDRLVARVEEGFQFLKIEAGHFTHADELLSRLRRFRDRVGDSPQLVLDMAWSWTEAKSKKPLLDALGEFGIAWVEDPFRSTDVESYKSLRQSCSLPIGGGDETSRAANMTALLAADALDVVRLDATTMGGIGACQFLSQQAHRQGVRVSHHEHPEIHEHLVFGLGIADHVEMFPTDRHFDRVYDLIEAPSFARVKQGMLAPSDSPGSGMRLNLDRMSGFARRYSCVNADG